MVALTDGTLETYVKQRNAVCLAFAIRGRGTQQQAAFALKIAPTIVSQVVRGFLIDQRQLDRLAEWVVKGYPGVHAKVLEATGYTLPDPS